jgi:mannose-6-phosphate isomerase
MHTMKCVSQNYDWGKEGYNSLVAQICLKNKIEINEEKPYAEYWMGAHPNGPSTVVIENNEIDISKYLAMKNYTLPFLYKVLSIKEALSIQLHPNKNLAEKLNNLDPQHYKDDNHKPELTIVISEKFELFYGMLSFSQSVRLIKSLELSLNQSEILSKIISEFLSSEDNSEKIHQLLINQLVLLSLEDTTKIIDHILNVTFPSISTHNWCHSKLLIASKLFEKYNYDKGILFSLFMNYYILDQGESLFIEPHVPHAYISGDCLECMANSDNVIRLGLTPKFIDTENFLKVILKIHLFLDS